MYASPRPVASVLLVHNEPLLGTGLRTVLEAQPDIKIIGELGEVDMAAPIVATEHPDAILIAARRLRSELFTSIDRLTKSYPDPAVLLIAPPADPLTPMRAIMAGASGYLPGHGSTELVVEAVRIVTYSGIVLPRCIAPTLFRLIAPALDERNLAVLRRLSAQEREVLDMLAAGKSNNEIADSMIVAEATVKKHVTHLMRKLGCRDRLQAGLLGWRLGLGRGFDIDGDPTQHEDAMPTLRLRTSMGDRRAADRCADPDEPARQADANAIKRPIAVIR